MCEHRMYVSFFKFKIQISRFDLCRFSDKHIDIIQRDINKNFNMMRFYINSAQCGFKLNSW